MLGEQSGGGEYGTKFLIFFKGKKENPWSSGIYPSYAHNILPSVPISIRMSETIRRNTGKVAQDSLFPYITSLHGLPATTQ